MADSLAKQLAADGVGCARAPRDRVLPAVHAATPHLVVLAGDAAHDRGAAIVGQLADGGPPNLPVVVVCAPQLGVLSPPALSRQVAVLVPEGGLVQTARRVGDLLANLQDEALAQQPLQQLVDALARPPGRSPAAGTAPAGVLAPAKAPQPTVPLGVINPAAAPAKAPQATAKLGVFAPPPQPSAAGEATPRGAGLKPPAASGRGAPAKAPLGVSGLAQSKAPPANSNAGAKAPLGVSGLGQSNAMAANTNAGAKAPHGVSGLGQSNAMAANTNGAFGTGGAAPQPRAADAKSPAAALRAPRAVSAPIAERTSSSAAHDYAPIGVAAPSVLEAKAPAEPSPKASLGVMAPAGAVVKGPQATGPLAVLGPAALAQAAELLATPPATAKAPLGVMAPAGAVVKGPQATGPLGVLSASQAKAFHATGALGVFAPAAQVEPQATAPAGFVAHGKAAEAIAAQAKAREEAATGADAHAKTLLIGAPEPAAALLAEEPPAVVATEAPQLAAAALQQLAPEIAVQSTRRVQSRTLMAAGGLAAKAAPARGADLVAHVLESAHAAGSTSGVMRTAEPEPAPDRDDFSISVSEPPHEEPAPKARTTTLQGSGLLSLSNFAGGAPAAKPAPAAPVAAPPVRRSDPPLETESPARPRRLRLWAAGSAAALLSAAAVLLLLLRAPESNAASPAAAAGTLQLAVAPRPETSKPDSAAIAPAPVPVVPEPPPAPGAVAAPAVEAVPAAAPELVRAVEPEPVRAVEHEAVPAAEPEPEPERAVEPEPERAVEPEPEHPSLQPSAAPAPLLPAVPDHGEPEDLEWTPTPQVLRAQAFVDRGLVLVKNDRLGLAEAAYLKALKVLPRYPRAMAALVRMHLQRKDGAEAARWAKRLVARQPARAHNHLMLGDAAALRGDLAAARAAWRKAARLGSASARARLKR